MLAPSPDMLAQLPAPKYHDVTILRTRKIAQARVEGVPPEEFGISRNARNIKHCGYCFHRVLRRHSELIAEGYDADQIHSLPTYVSSTNPEELSRDTVAESTIRTSDEGMNDANRQSWIIEHYINMDYEGDGKARLYRVTTGGSGGGDDSILRRDGDEQIIEIDEIPFAAMTPVIMTHRFFGRSIADLVMDIQRIKTALLRSLLDNAYLANNPRVEVSEAFATETTLDDLLVSRPGGIVRTKQPGGLNVLQHPDVGAFVFPLLQYQDATREWRTGVSRQGQGVDPDALQNQVATIANQMFNAAQAKMKLVARIFAETGIKDMFLLLHATIRRHGSQAATVRLRNKWVEVDPRSWQMRNDMTVNVGLGTGSKAEQLQQMQLVVAAQEKAIAAGMVSPKNLWNSAQELVRLIGRKDPESFFVNPSGQPDPNDPSSKPIQPPPDPKMQVEQMRLQHDQSRAQFEQQIASVKLQGEQQMAQLNAQLAQQQMQNDAMHQKLKAEADAALAQRKMELDAHFKLLEAQLRQQESEREHAYRVAEIALKERAQHEKNETAIAPVKAVKEIAEKMTAHLESHTKILAEASKPKKIRKNKDGSWQSESA